MRCDLHTHTVHSDGSFTPKELVKAAKEKNLIIALTDHNTVSGVTEFLDEAKREGVTAIGGAEISTEWEGIEFHLLGLFISPDYYQEVESLFDDFHRRKRQSNIDLIKKLNALGYDIDLSSVEKRNIKGRVNRAHIAAELIEKGYASSIGDAFDRILGEKCGLYVPAKRISLTDAIRFVRRIGAVPVLAHPLKEIDAENLVRILPELCEAGLVAIETMHSSCSDEQIALLKQIAADFDLLESGGSDFHGSIKPDVELGVGKGNLDIPDSIYHSLLSCKG